MSITISLCPAGRRHEIRPDAASVGDVLFGLLHRRIELFASGQSLRDGHATYAQAQRKVVLLHDRACASVGLANQTISLYTRLLSFRYLDGLPYLIVSQKASGLLSVVCCRLMKMITLFERRMGMDDVLVMTNELLR